MNNWYRTYSSIIMENISNEYPREVSDNYLINMVGNIHRSPIDLEEGNLIHRIQRFNKYILKELPLSSVNKDEWYVDDDLVDSYYDMSQQEQPPIIYDSIDHSIIDGTHRVNASLKRGEDRILAYVGLPEHEDEYWSEYQEEEYD